MTPIPLSNSRCPKCGGYDGCTVQHTPLKKTDGTVTKVECMTLTCRCCGYQWPVLPLDAEPESKETPATSGFLSVTDIEKMFGLRAGFISEKAAKAAKEEEARKLDIAARAYANSTHRDASGCDVPSHIAALGAFVAGANWEREQQAKEAR